MNGLILVVEDENEIREILCELFRSEGFSVLEASNGEEALQRLRNSVVKPILISLDIMMPVLDGQSFILKLQRSPEFKDFSHIPIVVVSAGRGELQGEIAASVPKPPDFERLIELARKFSTESSESLAPR